MTAETQDTVTSRTIIVRVSVGTHRALRIRVAEEDTSIQNWVSSLIERELGIGPDLGSGDDAGGRKRKG